MCSFTVIGIPDSKEFMLTDEAANALSHAHYFSGGKRHHQLVEELIPEDAEWIDVTLSLIHI